MKLIEYISTIAVPAVILVILLYGISEKKPIFDLFLKGAEEGIKMCFKLFPTLIGLFLAIGALRSSGLIDFIIELVKPIFEKIKYPIEVLPLMLIRPVSGSGSIAIATDIMKKFGVDSIIGIITATIMGSTETTLYAISVYTKAVDIKKIRFVLFAAIAADITGMAVAVWICRILSKSFSWQLGYFIVK